MKCPYALTAANRDSSGVAVSLRYTPTLLLCRALRGSCCCQCCLRFRDQFKARVEQKVMFKNVSLKICYHVMVFITARCSPYLKLRSSHLQGESAIYWTLIDPQPIVAAHQCSAIAQWIPVNFVEDGDKLCLCLPNVVWMECPYLPLAVAQSSSTSLSALCFLVWIQSFI